MKRILLLLALCPLCVATCLLLCPPPGVQAQGSFHDIYVGGVGSSRFDVRGGPPNATVVFNITQSSPGVMGYALEQPPPGGPWADSLAVPVSLDSNGGGSGAHYFYGKSAGASDQRTCSVQPACAEQVRCTADTPIHWTVTAPATSAKLQYLKGATFVDVSATLNVLRNDVVTFRAVPLPAGSRFYLNEPRWGGTSGATGQGETTTITFDTASRTTRDYKTITANVSVSGVAGGATTTANVVVADGVTAVTFEPLDPTGVIDTNPNTGGGQRIFPDKNAPGDTANRRKVKVKAHEIAHQFDLLDCGSSSHPCDSTIHDLMGSDYDRPDSRFSDADLNILRNRVRSPGR